MSAAVYVCRQFVEDVTAYLEGVLPDEITVLVELHLADCPHCREYLDQMRRTIELTRALTERDVDDMPADLRDRLLQAFLEPDEKQPFPEGDE
jgi:predicted anti-sigma-YlaC factor YlaD